MDKMLENLQQNLGKTYQLKNKSFTVVNELNRQREDIVSNLVSSPERAAELPELERRIEDERQVNRALTSAYQEGQRRLKLREQKLEDIQRQNAIRDRAL